MCLAQVHSIMTAATGDRTLITWFLSPDIGHGVRADYVLYVCNIECPTVCLFVIRSLDESITLVLLDGEQRRSETDCAVV